MWSGGRVLWARDRARVVQTAVGSVFARLRHKTQSRTHLADVAHGPGGRRERDAFVFRDHRVGGMDADEGGRDKGGAWGLVGVSFGDRYARNGRSTCRVDLGTPSPRICVTSKPHPAPFPANTVDERTARKHPSEDARRRFAHFPANARPPQTRTSCRTTRISPHRPRSTPASRGSPCTPRRKSSWRGLQRAPERAPRSTLDERMPMREKRGNRTRKMHRWQPLVFAKAQPLKSRKAFIW